MLIDDIEMSGLRSVYSADIEKRVTCPPPNLKLFQLLAGPRSQAKKRKGLLSARNIIPCLGQVLNLFRTEASQIVYPA